MRTKGLVVATALSIVAAIAATAITQNAYAQSSCEGERQSFKLIVRVVSNNPVEVMNSGLNANNLHVCIGDEIEWQLVGAAKQFYVNFVAGVPFDGAGKTNSNNNGKITIVVGGSAEPGESYKYDIGIVGGGVLDPRIIIDR